MEDQRPFATVVRGTRYSEEPVALPLHMKFARMAPSFQQFGDDAYMTLLRDALYSLIRYSFTDLTVANGAGSVDITLIVETTMRYASIYYHCTDYKTQEGVLQLLRSALGDIIRNYKSQQNCVAGLTAVSENLFSSIKELVESGRSS